MCKPLNSDALYMTVIAEQIRVARERKLNAKARRAHDGAHGFRISAAAVMREHLAELSQIEASAFEAAARARGCAILADYR